MKPSLTITTKYKIGTHHSYTIYTGSLSTKLYDMSKQMNKKHTYFKRKKKTLSFRNYVVAYIQYFNYEWDKIIN